MAGQRHMVVDTFITICDDDGGWAPAELPTLEVVTLFVRWLEKHRVEFDRSMLESLERNRQRNLSQQRKRKGRAEVIKLVRDNNRIESPESGE